MWPRFDWPSNVSWVPSMGRAGHEVQAIAAMNVDTVSPGRRSPAWRFSTAWIKRRVAGTAPSLTFPKPLDLSDALRIFPTAACSRWNPSRWLDCERRRGRAGLRRLQFCAAADTVMAGYQGPTDILVGVLGTDDEMVGIAIRETATTRMPSMSTTSAMRWVHRDVFNGKTLAEIGRSSISTEKPRSKESPGRR